MLKATILEYDPKKNTLTGRSKVELISKLALTQIFNLFPNNI